jgi:hypothetical protein
MDQSAEHIRDVSNSLYKYHLSNFLCDVFVIMPDGTEVPAHSIVLSAMSAKLRAAFESSESLTGKDFLYRLYVTECDIVIVEMVLQFIYTGAIVLPHETALDITRVLSCGQQLGLDAGKLASCLGVLLSLTDESAVESLPPVVLTDEDIKLEIVEKVSS